MNHLGDITKINGYAIPNVNCVIGGSPCQDLSQAGLRKGLAGERSGLFMEQIRIIKEMRDGAVKRADELVRFGIWENVPGVFSSNKGEDFRCVLEEFARVKEPGVSIPKPDKWSYAGAIIGDGWSIAWRTIDAQFWGVPQRRKRVHLLADFEGTAAPYILLCDECHGETNKTNSNSHIVGSSAGCTEEVLSVAESLPRDLESCISPWKGIAGNTEEGIDECYTLKLRHTGSDTTGGGAEH